MNTSLANIINISVDPKARKPRAIVEFIACVLSAYAYTFLLEDNDPAYVEIRRFVEGDADRNDLIDRLRLKAEINEMYMQFPVLEKDGSRNQLEWENFLKSSEWQYDENCSNLVLNGNTYSLDKQLLILSGSDEDGKFLAKRFRRDGQGAFFAPVGSNAGRERADHIQLFAERRKNNFDLIVTSEIEVDQEDFFELNEIVQKADEQQREAITSGIEKNLVILAGAGSGKTRTLVCRLAYLHLVYKIPLNEIMLLTFTTSAAREMQKRGEELIEKIYDKLGLHKKAVVNARTIDSFVINLIDNNYMQMGFTQKPVKCLDDTADALRDRCILLDSIITENRLEGVFKQYYDEDGKMNMSFHYLLDNLMGYARGLPINYAGFDVLLQLYLEKQRRSNKIMGFDEASLFVRNALNQDNSALRETIASRYSCIMLDEFQDVNMLQNSIFEPFYDSKMHFTFVGDDDQSIYFWRGSDSSIIKSFLDKPNTKVTFLLTNYRNNPTIVEAGNVILRTIEGRAKKDKPIHSHRETGPKIRVARYDNKFTNLANEVDRLLKSGQKAEEICILSRNREEGNAIAKAMTAADIPISRQNLKIDANDNYKLFKAILSILTKTNMIASIREIKRITECEDVPEWHVHKIVTGKCDELQCEGELLCIKELSDVFRQSDIQELDDAVYRYSIKAGELFENSINERHSDEIFAEFEEYCKNNNAPWPLKRKQLSELLSVFENDFRREMRKGRGFPNGVRISTIHSAKGLEYNVVIITSLADGQYPSTTQIDQMFMTRKQFLSSFQQAREEFMRIKQKVTPEMFRNMLNECDNPAFSQREMESFQQMQEEIFDIRDAIISFTADGVSDFMEVYQFHVEPLEEQYRADLCDTNTKLLNVRAEEERVSDEIILHKQEGELVPRELEEQLQSVQETVKQLISKKERIIDKAKRFNFAIHTISEFHSLCQTASGFLADMKKEDAIETMLQQLKDEREQRINEERRLFYVAVTRARDILYLCYSEGSAPSEFIRLIPENLRAEHLMLTRDEEQEVQRLTESLRQETSNAVVNDEKVNEQTEKLLSRNKIAAYIASRAKEFNATHPMVSSLNDEAKGYYNKAVGLLFLAELTGGEYKTEFAHNMQRVAELMLQNVSGPHAVPYKTKDDAAASRIISDIQNICGGIPAYGYLSKLLTGPDKFADELKTLKSAGVMHYILRSERYFVDESIQNTWKNLAPISTPDEFLKATMSLSAVRNMLIHRDADQWPEDPTPQIIHDLELIVQECSTKKTLLTPFEVQQKNDRSLKRELIVVGTKVRHSKYGIGEIISVSDTAFVVGFGAVQKAFILASAEKYFVKE